MLRAALCLLGWLCTVLAAAEAQAERRVALVVGNAGYVHAAELRNPRNDAHDMAEMLKRLGFEVLVGTDLDQRAFARLIDQFGRALEGADVGLFFYAGHGLQMNDRNYLVSTEARLENEFLVPAETVALDTVIGLMESRARVNLVFLDACRNNPLADRLRRTVAQANRSVSLGRGLARVDATGRDTLIAFAAAPGQEAADGRGRNSPFTAALLDHLPRPGVEVSVLLKDVTAQVRRETNNLQRPQQLSDMSRTFYFVKAEPAVAAVAAPARPADPAGDYAIEVAYWNSARSANDCESVRAYLERFPQGIFADLAKLAERRLCEPTRKVTVVEPAAPAAQAAAAPAPGAGPPAPSPLPAGESEPTLPVPPLGIKPAEPKVAALPPPAETLPAPPLPSPSRADLVRDLQRELARVGCLSDQPDGVWGARSREALRSFNRHAQATLDPEALTLETLAAVARHTARVCPPPRPARAQRDTESERPRAAPVPRRPRAAADDWRAISPLCQAPFPQGGRMCCSYDPPGGAPRILCP